MKDDLVEEAFRKATNIDVKRVKALFGALDAAATGYTNGEIFEAIFLLLKWCLWQKRHELETFLAVREFTAIIVRNMADGLEEMSPTIEVPS